MELGLSPLHLLLVLVIAAMWVVPIVLVVLGVRYLLERSRPDPRAILAERLTRGEIDIEQFNTAMRALGEPPGATRWGGGGMRPPADPAAGDDRGVPREPPAPGHQNG